jgi:hypothetical protein
LFLYNPFLTIVPPSSSLNIHHIASYRATVAASELQHFSPTDGRKIYSPPAAPLLSWFEVFVNLPSGSFAEVSSDAPVIRQFFCADLWSRPPPVI